MALLAKAFSSVIIMMVTLCVLSLAACGSEASEAKAKERREMVITAILNQHYAEMEEQAEENRKNAKQLTPEQQAHVRAMLREAGVQ